MTSSNPAPRWPVGSLVVERGVPPGPLTLRMIVGYRPGGRVMTSYVQGPPWLTRDQQLQIYEDLVDLVLPYPEVLERAEELIAEQG